MDKGACHTASFAQADLQNPHPSRRNSKKLSSAHHKCAMVLVCTTPAPRLKIGAGEMA